MAYAKRNRTWHMSSIQLRPFGIESFSISENNQIEMAIKWVHL